MADSTPENLTSEDEAVPTPTQAEQPERDWMQILEILTAIMLAITTVLTAWSAYQSTRWSGIQSREYARASTNRVEASRSFNLGAQKYALDTNTFSMYAAAYSAQNEPLTTFYHTNVMRLEFIPYLDRWLASDPLNAPAGSNVLRSPLEDPEYLNTLFLESQELEAKADQYFADAQESNRTRDDYVLGSVFFASVLFFAGISSKFRTVKVRSILVVAGVVMLVIGLIQVAGLPTA